jgi:hypothetical protein
VESAVDPLEKLRDIHLPLDPNWWPPAPGWWIILCLFMVIVVFLVRACVSAHRRRQAGLIAIKSLNEIEQGYKHNRNTQDTIRQLSVLLRRHALAVDHQKPVAGLGGDAWLQYLDQKSNGKKFSQGVGHSLITAPYRPDPTVDFAALFPLIRELFKTSRAPKDMKRSK